MWQKKEQRQTCGKKGNKDMPHVCLGSLFCHMFVLVPFFATCLSWFPFLPHVYRCSFFDYMLVFALFFCHMFVFVPLLWQKREQRQTCGKKGNQDKHVAKKGTKTNMWQKREPRQTCGKKGTKANMWQKGFTTCISMLLF
jgi:hypothetical protein